LRFWYDPRSDAQILLVPVPFLMRYRHPCDCSDYGDVLVIVYKLVRGSYLRGILVFTDYKHFFRMYIAPVTQDRHAYVIGLDRVPRQWEEDPAWDPSFFKAAAQPLPPSSKWVSPSRWLPTGTQSAHTLVEHFILSNEIPRLEQIRTTNW
jgi:hypothetical protein